MIDKFSVFGFTWLFIRKVYNYVENIHRKDCWSALFIHCCCCLLLESGSIYPLYSPSHHVINNFITYYVWIYQCDKAANKNDTCEVI